MFEENQIDTVLHFAAQTHVDNSFGNSFSFTKNNVMGTHVLLEAAKLAHVSRFIHVSTDEVYGEGIQENSASSPMQEEHVLEPTNPYAATKAAAEFLAKSYHRSFSLPLIITRGNNVYGPHQFPEKLIPKFIHQLDRNEKVTVHGTGLNRRNFLYVTDVANAFDVILHKGIVGSIYNIGGTNERTNLNVAETLIRTMKGGDDDGTDTSEWMTFVEDRCFNDVRYNIDGQRLHDLGWKEETSWEDGIARTVEWYTEREGGEEGERGELIERWSKSLVAAATVAHPRMMGKSAEF